ncbi:MAG TPA: tetratricopeptide repeat protein [Acidobacteriota bacterium]|nr:tetratricopeptide repeat protein [Acidobacteriota bacterium]
MKKSFLIVAIGILTIILSAASPSFAQYARQAGRVSDEQGNPIAGAEVKFDKVEVTSSRDHQVTTTDDKGLFILTGIRGGRWNIAVTATGYAPYQGVVQVYSYGNNENLNITLVKLEEAPPASGSRDEAESKVEQARQLVEEGKFDEAIELYQNYYAENPQLISINLLIGEVYEKKMDYKSAIASYAKVLEQEPDNLNALRMMGIALIRNKEYDEAEKYFVRLVEIKSDDPIIMYTLGEIMLDGGQTARAIEYYAKAVELNPDFADAHMKLGYACYGEKRWADAIKHFEKFIELAPDRPEVQFVQSDLDICREKLKEK